MNKQTKTITKRRSVLRSQFNFSARVDRAKDCDWLLRMVRLDLSICVRYDPFGVCPSGA